MSVSRTVCEIFSDKWWRAWPWNVG